VRSSETADRPTDLRAWLERALRRRAPGYPGPIDDATPLAEDGLCLDSLTLMDLLTEIEATFGIVLGEDEITPANLGTAGRLRQFLEGRCRADNGGPHSAARGLAQ
jgi:acyl carrier protein